LSDVDKEDATTKITGVVGMVKAWKTGKGYFLNLNGDDNDYYGFGSCKAKEGEEVVIDVKEGTGSFADKVCITKLTVGKDAAGTAKKTSREPAPAATPEVRQGDSVYFRKDELIVKQCCVKAAARITAALIAAGYSKSKKDAIDDTVDVADKMYCYIVDLDEPDEPEQDAE